MFISLYLSEPLGLVVWHSCGRRHHSLPVNLVTSFCWCRQPSTGLFPRNGHPVEDCIADNAEEPRRNCGKPFHLITGRCMGHTDCTEAGEMSALDFTDSIVMDESTQSPVTFEVIKKASNKGYHHHHQFDTHECSMNNKTYMIYMMLVDSHGFSYRC